MTAEGATGELALGAVFGGYRIQSVLGRGGMGVVYRAEELALGRPVALKVIAQSRLQDEWARVQFVREARVAASLDHPNVVPIYTAGQHEGTAFMAMRLVEGHDLQSEVRHRGPFSPQRAVAVLSQLASALDAAHAAGLVHRDVKPANVLLAPGDHVYLTDFGIAQHARPGRRAGAAAAGPLVGTVGYLAPEAAGGAPPHATADVYALGCLLYFALTGSSPFAGADRDAVLAAHRSAPAPLVSEAFAGVPTSFDAVVARALAKDPAARFGTAGELAAAARSALADAADDQTISGPPPDVPPAVALRLAPPPVEPAPPLPVQLTPLFGRDAELDALVDRFLRAGQRLVTLVGPGGVGKSRLALEAARRLHGAYRDGSRFVPLAGVADARDVAAAVGRSLSLVAREGEPPREALLRHLGPRHLLLVLDNFEQIVDAADLVAELLAEAPELAVLVTSREATRLAAEHVQPVRPLDLPAAAEMFCDRARARDPAFEAAGHVESICRRLDGLPLALELAAARVALLEPGDLAARLDSALTLLVGGARDAPERHRALRATIEWSVRLLDDHEREAYARFGVFAGGATLAAAEEITGASLDVLESLIAKSLLTREEARLVMLETLREYALEQLGDDDEVWERLARWALRTAHEATPQLVTARRLEWLARLDRELPNVVAALAWAVRTRSGAVALDLADALGPYWRATQQWQEALPWLEAAIDSAPDAPPLARARVLLWRARLASEFPWRKANYREAVGRALELFREAGDAAGVVACLGEFAKAAIHVGDFDRARDIAEESCRIAEESQDPVAIARALTRRAVSADAYDDVARLAVPAVEALAKIGDLAEVTNLAANIGYVAIVNDRYDEALEWLDRCLAGAHEIDDRLSVFVAHENRGLALAFLGHWSDAAVAFAQALRACRPAGAEDLVDEALLGVAAVAFTRGDLELAARLAGAAATHANPVRGAQEQIVRTRLEDVVAEARERLGPEAWDTAAAAGAELPVEAAIELALAAATPDRSTPS